MSWLKSAVSKVREQGEALKQSNALRALQERTANVVVTGAEQIRRVSGAVGAAHSSKTASELVEKLEQRARSTRTAVALADLYGDWLRQLAPKEGAATPASAERGHSAAFRELLLQSRAIELTIENIACDEEIRQHFAKTPAADDETSPGAVLREVLSRLLACPAGHLSEVLRVIFSIEGEVGETQLQWLLSIVNVTKCDWQEEQLRAERKDLALRAEGLRQDIHRLGGEPGEDIDAWYNQRTQLSTDLLNTYQAVRQNLEEAQNHRRELITARESDLRLLGEQLQAHAVGLEGSARTAADKQRQLQGELKQSRDGFQAQLQQMDEARAEIDRELAQLEERKKKLRMELDEVSRTLDEVRTKQRQHMEVCDKRRAEVAEQKATFKEQIDNEDSAAKEAERNKGLAERTQELVRATDTLVQQTLGTQLEELTRKQTQFQDHFKELLRGHLTYSEEQLSHLRSRAEQLMSAPFPDVTAKAAISTASQAAQQALRVFSDEHSTLLHGTAMEVSLQRLDAGHAAVLELLKPTVSGAETTSEAAAGPEPAAAEAGGPAAAAAAVSAAAAAPENPEPAAAPSAEHAFSPPPRGEPGGAGAAPDVAETPPPAAAAASAEALAADAIASTAPAASPTGSVAAPATAPEERAIV